MSLDPAKKEALQKRIVIGLAVVFLGILVNGPLKKRMGVGAQPVPMTAPAGVAPTAPVAIEPGGGPALLQRASFGSANAEPKDAALIYTVGTWRDPMKSLLPTPTVNTPTDHPVVAATPSTPEAAHPPAAMAMKIQGLVWGGQTPSVIINNQTYRLNDFIERSQIVAIERDGVTLLQDGHRLFYPGPQTPAGGSKAYSQQAQWR